MPVAIWEDIMSGRGLKIGGIAAVLLGSAVVAHAGGFERSSQDFDILFEQGNAVDASGTFVARNASSRIFVVLQSAR